MATRNYLSCCSIFCNSSNYLPVLYFGSIVRKNYLTNGWIEVSDTADQLSGNIKVKSKIGDYAILAIIVALSLTIAIQLLS